MDKFKVDFNWEYAKILEPVFDFKGRYIILKGGRSSSKSHFVARKTLEDRLYKKRDLLCVREYQANLKQSNYKLFKQLIEFYKLPFKVYSDYFKSETTGAEIVFVGMNDLTADNIKSYEGFADAWIEEAQNFSLNSFQKLDPTIRQDDSQIFATMNPKTNDDPVLKEVENLYKDDSLIIHINYLDNPFCPEPMKKMAEQCRINKPDDYAYIWLGIPDDNHNLNVVKHFTDDNIRRLHYLPNYPLHLSCDFNVDPMMWVVAQKTNEAVYFLDEIVIENTTSKAAAQEFIKRYGNHLADIIVNGDASGDNRCVQSDISNYVIIRNELQRHFNRKVDIQIRRHNPPIKNRVNAWNEMVLDINGKRRIYIDPKCVWLVYNCKQFKYKEGTSDFDTPTHVQIRNDRSLKFLGHIFDAASYLIEFYFPIKNEKSPDFNAN